MNTNNSALINQLIQIMARLRDAENGCPWDIEQNFDSIIPYTIEETFEVVDAIEKKDWHALKDELGDLLLQILFYTQMATEENLFTFDDVALNLKEKLIRRHPHVFGEKDENGKPLEKENWESIKKKERSEKQSEQKSILENIPISLPALNRAIKIQKRCAKVGFDWQSLGPVVEKVHEEIDEVMEEAQCIDRNQTRIEEEMGDLLFAVTNLARHLDCDPETALRKANNKFEQRFRKLEEKVSKTPKTLEQYQLDELENFWQQVKSSQ